MNNIFFTNGCFDLLHVGHIELLRYAKSLGDYLVVGINSDSSIKKLKGDGVSEDAIKEAEDKIQKKTDAYITRIDQVFNEKEKDIMSV